MRHKDPKHKSKSSSVIKSPDTLKLNKLFDWLYPKAMTATTKTRCTHQTQAEFPGTGHHLLGSGREGTFLFPPLAKDAFGNGLSCLFFKFLWSGLTSSERPRSVWDGHSAFWEISPFKILQSRHPWNYLTHMTRTHKYLPPKLLKTSLVV